MNGFARHSIEGELSIGAVVPANAVEPAPSQTAGVVCDLRDASGTARGPA